jgi:hypothetical protein
MARYQVVGMGGLPRHGSSAFLPVPPHHVTPASATHGMVMIEGSPGTNRVPSPRPRGLAHGGHYRGAPGPSQVAPDYILPQIWFTHVTNMAPNNGHLSWMPGDTIIPVPAGDVIRTPPIAMKRRRVGGSEALQWPRVITRWRLRGS